MLVTALGAAALTLSAFGVHGLGQKDEGKTKIVPPPAGAKDVHLLFFGKPEEVAQNWVRYGSDQPADWKVKEGGMEAEGGDIGSKEKFTDCYLHVEFREPFMPNEHGQGRGNSGVFLSNHYEIQVLDSYGIADPGTGDCGAVYDHAAPLVNACKPPLQWQTYDILYRAPRYDANHQLVEHAHVTVFQNGIPVQNNQEIVGPTDGYKPAPDEDFSQPAPIRLQYHHCPVRYRNIWVVPLPPHGAEHY
jgi:hypothetical protein